MFPSVVWGGFKWPFVEDLLNTPTFLEFSQWMAFKYPDHDGDLGPLILGRGGVYLQRASAQDQPGAAARKSSLAPITPFGLDPDRHFEVALAAHATGSPLDWAGPGDLDLEYAAHVMSQGPAYVESKRKLNAAVFAELSSRLWPVSVFLHSQQLPTVHGVNPSVHLALIAVLVLMMAWPDTSFPSCLFSGFPAVGHAPPCGLWDTRPSQHISLDTIFAEGRSDAEQLLSRIKPGPDDQVAFEAGNQDEQLGFCSSPFSWQSLLSLGRPFRIIRRFVIEQASGKKRVIDDASASRQSEFSSDGNRLRFCSAIQPCLHLQALQTAMGCPPWRWPDHILSSGEDLPQAYRKIPMIPDHSSACLVAYRDPVQQIIQFRQYYGMLFGLPLAVTAYNRLPFLLQSCIRRFCLVLGTFYFDDLNVQDWASTASRSQEFVRSLVCQLGYPFAAEKQQVPAIENDFLGLVHDLSTVTSDGMIRLWARDRLIQKIDSLMQHAEDHDRLPSGLASKLFGCLGFLDQGTFGRMARAGLNSLKERQYMQDCTLTTELRDTFVLVRALLEVKPCRQVQLDSSWYTHVTVASDASQDMPRQGKAGTLLVHPFAGGTVIAIDANIFQLWSDHPTKIAQLEMLCCPARPFDISIAVPANQSCLVCRQHRSLHGSVERAIR